MPVTINKDNFDAEIKQSDKPIVIDVYATWCGPCQQMKPIFTELAKEFEGKCKFAALNVDEARDLSIMFGVTSVPTFVFYNNGEMHSKDTGYMSKEALKARVEDFLASV
ncbi:MAG: thioredoxin [Epsilonproteobacteria bacterium]|nr:thioredoxin [Campylobacterota bacterium]|tara:strand:+ start:1113 stop:1439 length:327 start_codon:yes stop_codon:yes gene_type:complete